MARFLTCLLLAYCHAGPALADWRDDVGFTRLQEISAADLPAAPSRGFSQIEASQTPSPPTFLPDFQSPLFADKSFTNRSAATGSDISSHATRVGRNFYGSGTSLVTGACPVDAYLVDDWFNDAFLQTGVNTEPLIEARAVQNHSWVATSNSFPNTSAQEINRRLDFAIHRDGFVCVVGSDNAGTSTLPQLLAQSYNSISVGRDDGGHSAGFTDFDGSGRSKPDLVAPSAAPEFATSWTTPMVASAAGLLHAKLVAAPYSLAEADLPRVIKALLLSSATKPPAWSNSPARPLDAEFGAGVLNVYHAYQTLRSGRVSAAPSTSHPARSWAAESVSGNSSKTYYFTLTADSIATPFRAALTWHRIVTKSRFGVWSASLANLNLRLYQTNGFTLGSLLAASTSAVDNLELIDQATLAPGTYALVVENSSNTAAAFALAWQTLPSVKIIANPAVASEQSGPPAQITVTRSGTLTLPLLVPLTYAGTAQAGIDFPPLPSHLIIPAGQVSATLPIPVISNDLAQGNRSLDVKIPADFALVRDSSQSAAVLLLDKPYDAWRFSNFTPAESALSTELADPDGDSLVNLTEYALGLDPRTAAPAPVSPSLVGGFLSLSVSKNPSASDLTWAAETSADLLTWQAAQTLADTSTRFSARDSESLSTAGRRFIRLKITRVP